MSPKSLRWQYRTLRLAMTVGCVSSLQFVGCINNSTRSDLASEAGKAALIAEEDLAHQKIEKAAGTASEDRDSDIGRVAQAGGLATEENGDSPILQTGGETAEATPKKSFWSFLTPKPKKPAVKDPFADSPELKSTAKSEDPTASPGKARLASSSVAVPESGTPEKEPYAPEKWFEKELANQPAPSWASAADQNVLADNKNKPQVPFGESGRSLGAASKETDPFRRESTWIPQKSNPTEQAQSSDSFPWATASTPGSNGPENHSAATRPAPSNPGSPGAMNSLAMRQQKLRIQALMSEAHTCALRGELHAAYRCALLAEKAAQDANLTFAEGEETPEQFARALAARLWRTSNASEETYLAATESAATASKPATTENQRRPAPEAKAAITANSPFPTGSFATWQPFPENPTQRHSVTANGQTLSQSATSSEASMASTARQSAAFPARSGTAADLLPEIRPWPNERVVRNAQPPLEFSSSTAMTPATSPQASAVDATQHQPSNTSTDRQRQPGNDPGVQFAIAHEVHEEQTPQLIDPFAPRAENRGGDFSRSGKPQQMASAALDQQRPVLLAPPVPADNSARSLAESTLTWEQLSNSRGADRSGKTATTAGSSTAWRMIWSVLGLIAAGLCTAAGIWYSRRNSSELDQENGAAVQVPAASEPKPVTPSLEIAVDVAAGGEEPEIQPLQFKRAA